MQTLLSTGFVVDAPEDGTIFPAAGGNSGNPRVQAVYWRCLVSFFASARISNPDQRLALFTNVTPPLVDGTDLGEVLNRYGVEIRKVPLTARLPARRVKAWGNVLYFFDIMDSLGQEDADLRIALTDSDVLVTGLLDPLFAQLDTTGFGGYHVDATTPDHNVNSLSRREMAGIAAAMGGTPGEMVDHFGGELLLATPRSWAQHRPMFRAMLEDAQRGEGPAADVLTEEHIYSIAFSMIEPAPARANAQIKRMWTSRDYNTVVDGDQNLPVWHLPAEKRYGLRDLYFELKRQGFPTQMPAGLLHRRAMALCGIPHKTTSKVLRDTIRQIGSKLSEKF